MQCFPGRPPAACVDIVFNRNMAINRIYKSCHVSGLPRPWIFCSDATTGHAVWPLDLFETRSNL
jgi:hypothetical protein